MAVTRDLYCLNLLAELMLLLHQILFNLPIAVIAEAKERRLNLNPSKVMNL